MQNQNTRYDYFLIWGNGLQHKEGILQMLREETSFDIIKIVEHETKDIEKFVKKVYAHDYAPYKHLKGKTKYLLATAPKVIFIFIRNKAVDEEYFGEGRYRHIESKTVKRIKELIRNKYNERKDERRTENHVIHASDNENQTEHILKYIGFPTGFDIFKSDSDILFFPQLSNKGAFTIEKIPINSFYAAIITGNPGNPTKVTAIEDSPHYKYLQGEKAPYKNYTEKFRGIFLQDDHNTEKFEKLSQTFSYLDEDHPTNYIMVKKLGEEKYLVLDGLHRIAILKHRGADFVISAIIE